MRVLVTGKDGQLGKSIYKVVANSKQNYEFLFVGRKELDLSDNNAIVGYFDNNKFDIIVNCAAYTSVDKAEEEQELANQVNHLAIKQLTTIANTQKAKLIHISTDYVFDGESDKPYTEKDETNPINVYGKTKLAGEKVLQEAMPINAIIIRVSWLYSEYGENFVNTLLKKGKERDELNVVSDQIGSPTYAIDLSKIILRIIYSNKFNEPNQATQIYHFSNEGEISWYQFAKEVFRLAEIDCKVNPIKTSQNSTSAQRPKNSSMNKDKIIRELLIEVNSWKKSLESALKYNVF